MLQGPSVQADLVVDPRALSQIRPEVAKMHVQTSEQGGIRFRFSLCRPRFFVVTGLFPGAIFRDFKKGLVIGTQCGRHPVKTVKQIRFGLAGKHAFLLSVC